MAVASQLHEERERRGREAQKASDDESGAGSAGDVQRGHKHIVALNTSGGYTVIKSGKVIQRAALPWGWMFCYVLLESC